MENLSTETDALALDKARRHEKARIIKAFRSGVDDFIERAAYSVGSGEGSNDYLKGLFDIASRGLLIAYEEMDWQEDD